MLDYFTSFYSNTPNKITLPRLARYINTLSSFSSSYLDRYFQKDETLETNIFRYIKRIVSPFTLSSKELNLLNNDFEIISYVSDLLEQNENLFDGYNKFYVESGMFFTHFVDKIPECYLFVKNIVSYKFYPIGNEYSSWLRLTPIKLLSHDSNEYTIKLSKGRLNFSSFLPSYAFILIDLMTLMILWVKYQKIKLSKKDDIDYHEFINNNILKNTIYHSQNAWLINLYSNIISTVYSQIDIDTNVKITKDDLFIFHDDMFNYIDTDLEKVIYEIQKLCIDIHNGAKEPKVVLNSIKLLNGMSLNRYMVHINNLTQYRYSDSLEWIVFLKDFKLFELLWNTYKLSSNRTEVKNFHRNIKMVKYKYNRLKIWDQIHDPFFKEHIKSKMIRYINTIADSKLD